MKIIIIRHGQTEENSQGIIMGHNPGTLSALGKEQARKLALRLKEEKIDYIYSSDLNRKVKTVEEIVKYHPDVPVEFTEKLRERFLGEWQGKSKEDLGFSKDDSASAGVGLNPKDGETPEEMFNRAKKFLQRIISKHQNDVVLVAGHNGINKALITVIMGKCPENIKEVENHHNTAVSIFEIDENRNHEMKTFNCDKHLK